MADSGVISLTNLLSFFKEYLSQLQKGENSFKSGNVMNAQFDPEVHPVLLKGEVQASMKNRTYTVQISLDVEDGIVDATCSCPRGQLVCHHMAALCLFGNSHFSITDKPCAWSVPKKSADVDEVKDISQLFPMKKKNFRACKRMPTEEEIETFVKSLEEPVGFSWLLKPEPSDISLNVVPSIQDILFSKDYLESSNKSQYFLGASHVSQEVILKVAEITEGQYRNENWLVLRRHRLTASNFGQVLAACRRNKYPPSLFKSLMGGYDLDGVKAIQWGREHEAEALDCFRVGLEMDVSPTGLWLDECGFLGASPDGLVGEEAIIEIKCPYKYKDASLVEALTTDKSYIIYKNDSGQTLINHDHTYWHQIQGQLHITKRKLCYLVVWTPKEIEVVAIEKCNEWCENVILLKNFFIDKFIPYLCS